MYTATFHFSVMLKYTDFITDKLADRRQKNIIKKSEKKNRKLISKNRKTVNITREILFLCFHS